MNYDTEESVQFSTPIISIGREEVVLNSENCKSTSKGKKSHGFHLVRSKWDPYPWIGSVESSSSANKSGLRSGDCLLEIDGLDVLGLEMKDIAFLIGKNERVNLSIWRRPSKSSPRAVNVDVACLKEKYSREYISSRAEREHTETLLEGPLPEVAQKLVKAVSGVVKALECPVCLDSAAPPVSQCVHGHLLCFGCRLKTTRCPVCRVRLGQGRCLLADKSHRVLTEALVDSPSNCTAAEHSSKTRNHSLHDSIFGPTNQTKKHKSSGSARKVKDMMSKILSSNISDERNVSTESLPTTSCAMDGNLLYGRRWLLRLYDRRKSASTGELNRGDIADENSTNGSLTELRVGQESDKSESMLSVPQTPAWGGSTESVTTSRLRCPLKERTGCREYINCNTLIDHLSTHHSGPLVYFHKNIVTLPFPFPFQEDAVYILHHRDENFIIFNKLHNIWISNSEVNCGINWDWILHAVADDGTEVHLRKEVCSLREPLELLSRHIALLPKNFSTSSITISIIELDVEGCVKV